MSPEYLMELADLADPDQLWRLPVFDALSLPPEKRRQLDTGVALRRHANHIERLRNLLPLGKSLLITPLSDNGAAFMTVDPPPKHKEMLELRTAHIERAERVSRDGSFEVNTKAPKKPDTP